LLEREGLLVCTSGYSRKSSKNVDSLLVAKGHLRNKPAGELGSPGSMIFGASHRPPVAVVARIASFPRTWQHLTGHTLPGTTSGVNTLSVADVSFANHEGSI